MLGKKRDREIERERGERKGGQRERESERGRKAEYGNNKEIHLYFHHLKITQETILDLNIGVSSINLVCLSKTYFLHIEVYLKSSREKN